MSTIHYFARASTPGRELACWICAPLIRCLWAKIDTEPRSGCRARSSSVNSLGGTVDSETVAVRPEQKLNGPYTMSLVAVLYDWPGA